MTVCIQNNIILKNLSQNKKTGTNAEKQENEQSGQSHLIVRSKEHFA